MASYPATVHLVPNNIARESRDRGIQLRELSVTADGDFDSDELSTGISFVISIAGDGREDVLPTSPSSVRTTRRSPRRSAIRRRSP